MIGGILWRSSICVQWTSQIDRRLALLATHPDRHAGEKETTKDLLEERGGLPFQ